VAILDNISDGSERRGDKEFKHYLSISKGSCGEVRSMLYLGYELKYISKQEFEELYATAVETSKMIAGLTKALNF
jgi:four helix bundle protein